MPPNTADRSQRHYISGPTRRPSVAFTARKYQRSAGLVAPASLTGNTRITATAEDEENHENGLKVSQQSIETKASLKSFAPTERFAVCRMSIRTSRERKNTVRRCFLTKEVKADAHSDNKVTPRKCIANEIWHDGLVMHISWGLSATTCELSARCFICIGYWFSLSPFDEYSSNKLQLSLFITTMVNSASYVQLVTYVEDAATVV